LLDYLQPDFADEPPPRPGPSLHRAAGAGP
jgi:hypothetical protein